MAKKKVPDKHAHVSEKKKETVAELIKLLKGKKTILIASIKGIPGSQFQEIGKKLRGTAVVKVPRKGIISRAIDDAGIPELKHLKAQLTESSAILFSDADSFELAADLISKKSPAKAKPGQEAPADIEIPAGPTDLVPGPAISEFGALGIPIQIEKGKITIKETKVITKAGEKISKPAAEMMTKLSIRPFSIGFIPLAAYDSKDKKIYTSIQIDPEATVKSLKESFSKALGFAVGIAFPSEETIKFLIQKAGRQELALSRITNEQRVPEAQTDVLVEANQTQVNSQEENK